MISVRTLIALGVAPTQARLFAEPLAAACARFAINTPARVAGFVAQCRVESDEFRTLEEDLRYRTPEVLDRTFSLVRGLDDAARLMLQNYQIDTSKTQNTKPNIFTHKIDFSLKLDNIDSIKISINNQLLIKGKDYILKGNDIYLEQKYSTAKAKIHLYSRVKGNYGRYEGTNIFTEFTKLEELPYVKLNKVSNQPIFEVKNSKDFFTKLPSIFYKTTKTEDTLRTILEANKLGKNPLVIINGEEYPSSVLYRINPNSTKGYQMYSKGSQRAIEKYGLRAEDGVIILNTTKNKELLLENERQHRIAIENVKKQLEAPKKRVQRIVLKDLDGKEYEKVSVMRIDKSTLNFSVDVPIGGKILYLVDGKIVNEEDIERGNQIYNNGGCGEKFGVELMRLLGESAKNYNAYFNLYTK